MIYRLPPLNALRVFEAAARHLSFKEAAVELHITQAAVSHQVKALEEYLGVQLFKRSARGVQLTEVGAAAAKKLSADANPRFRCETTSIIFDWTFDGPVNRITQNRDTIVIEYGQLNLRRTINMNQKTHPANVKPSRAGHSIGRWEGDVLVVDTTNFLPGVVTGQTPHGNKLRVIERFSLDPKTMRLTRQYTAEDPEYFTGQITGQDVVQVADAPYVKDNCKEQQFVNYSKEANK